MHLFLLLPAITVILIFLERMREVATRRDTVHGDRKETLTFKAFMFCGIAMVVGGLAEWWLRGMPFSPAGLLTGTGMAVASFAIRRAAIAALGKFWSLHVEMRDGHEFVTSGPFRWMRHPVYFSMILEQLGTALILGAWFTLVGVALVFVPALILRLSLEEAALREKFGLAYEEYQRTTPAIIPLLYFRTPSAIAHLLRS